MHTQVKFLRTHGFYGVLLMASYPNIAFGEDVILSEILSLNRLWLKIWVKYKRIRWDGIGHDRKECDWNGNSSIRRKIRL
jgi:hypothetical protein